MPTVTGALYAGIKFGYGLKVQQTPMNPEELVPWSPLFSRSLL